MNVRRIAPIAVTVSCALPLGGAEAATYEVRATYSEINWDRWYAPDAWRLDKYDAIEGTRKVAERRIGGFAEAQAKCRRRSKRRARCRWEGFDAERGGFEGTSRVRLIRRGSKLFMRIRMPEPVPCEPADFDGNDVGDPPYDHECSALRSSDGVTQVS